MVIGREMWPALYQHFHIMKPCRSAGSELPPLVLIAYKVFPFVGICGFPVFFDVVTWSNLRSLQNENLCKKSMAKEIVFVVGKWKMPFFPNQGLYLNVKEEGLFTLIKQLNSIVPEVGRARQEVGSCSASLL